MDAASEPDLNPELWHGRGFTLAAVALELQMALTWSIENVKDTEEIQTTEHAGVTTAIVFATMGMGLHKITDKNLPEWHLRLAIYQALHGDLLQGPSEACDLKSEADPDHDHARECYGTHPLTWEHVDRRVGLETNAFPDLGRAKWLKRLAANYEYDVNRQVRGEREKANGMVAL